MVQPQPLNPPLVQYTTLIAQHAFDDAATLLVELAPSLIDTGSAYTWFTLFKQLPPPVHATRADLLLLAGDAWRVHNDWSHAALYYHQARHAAHVTGERSHLVKAVCRQALLCWSRGDVAGALAHYEEATTLCDAAMLASDMGYDLESGYALALSSVGRLVDAEACLQRQLRHAQRRAEIDREWLLLHNLAVMVYLRRGAFPLAEQTAREGLRLVHAHQHVLGEAYLTNSLAYILQWQGQPHEVLALSARALTLGQTLDIPNVQAFALLNQAWALYQEGDAQAAAAACARGLGCLHSPHSSPLWCDLLMLQSQLQRRHSVAQACHTAQDALAAARVQGDQWTTGLVLLHLADVSLEAAHLDRAHTALAEAQAIFAQYGDRSHGLRCRFLAAQLAVRQQDWAAFTQQLPMLFADQYSYPALTAQMLTGLTDLLAASVDQDPTHAASLFPFTSTWGEAFAPLAHALLAHPSSRVRSWTIGVLMYLSTPWAAALLAEHAPPVVHLPTVTSAVQQSPMVHNAFHVRTRQAGTLERDLHANAAKDGVVEATSIRQVNGYPLHNSAPNTSRIEADDACTGTTGAPQPAFTPREWQVLRALPGGKTNQQIASHLCVTERTVGFHLQNIYAKLGVANRGQAVAWLLRHDGGND